MAVQAPKFEVSAHLHGGPRCTKTKHDAACQGFEISCIGPKVTAGALRGIPAERRDEVIPVLKRLYVCVHLRPAR